MLYILTIFMHFEVFVISHAHSRAYISFLFSHVSIACTLPLSSCVSLHRYKGVVVELEPLSWSRKKQSAEKVVASKAMEEARRRAVIAMKHGKTLCLDLGAMGSGSNFVEVPTYAFETHAPFLFVVRICKLPRLPLRPRASFSWTTLVRVIIVLIWHSFLKS